MDQQENFNELLRRYSLDECSPAERKAIEDMILKYPRSGDWDWKSELHKRRMRDKMRNGILNRLKPNLQEQSRLLSRRRTWKIVAAASILLFIGLGVLLRLAGLTDRYQQQVVIRPLPFASGSEVILSLSNGKSFSFANDVIGITRNAEGFIIEKVDENRMITEEELKFSSSFKGFENLAMRNYVRVPNSRQFRLTLLDGTVIWLNAGSSLMFSDLFGNSQRKVSLQGEGFFNVAHQRNQTFMVSAKNTEVIVTGTKFNVSAYPQDTYVATTLLEGGVEIRNEQSSRNLKPGQQAISRENQETIDLAQVNAANALSWHHGYFSFYSQDLMSIMKDVSKWYGVTVTLQGEIPLKKIGGSFPTSAPLDELLDDLKTLIQFNYEIKGKEVLIMP